MGAPEQAADPAAADRVWVGYHPRAMVPVVALTAVASLVVWTGLWYLDDLLDLAKRFGGWAVFAAAWGPWPAVAAVFLYRTVTQTYRLTDRAVLADHGPLFGPTPPIPLTEVTAVVVGGGALARRLGVGWVEVRAGERAVRLKGVRNPSLFAEKVRAATVAARGRG